MVEPPVAPKKAMRGLLFAIADTGDSVLLNGLGDLANLKDLGRGRRYLELEYMDPALYSIWMTAWTARVLEASHFRCNGVPFIHVAVTAAQQWQCHRRTGRCVFSVGHFAKSEKQWVEAGYCSQLVKCGLRAEDLTLGRAQESG